MPGRTAWLAAGQVGSDWPGIVERINARAGQATGRAFAGSRGRAVRHSERQRAGRGARGRANGWQATAGEIAPGQARRWLERGLPGQIGAGRTPGEEGPPGLPPQRIFELRKRMLTLMLIGVAFRPSTEAI